MPVEPAFPRLPDPTRGFAGSTGARSVAGLWFAYAAITVVRAIAPLSVLWLAYRIAPSVRMLSSVAELPEQLSFLPACLASWLAEPWANRVLDIWSGLESCFLLATIWRARRLSRRRLPIAFPPGERKAAITRVIDHIVASAARTGCIDPSDGSRTVPGRCDEDCPHTLLRGWMRGAPWPSLALPHAQAWLAWALFSSPFDELSAVQCAEVDGIHTSLLQVLLGEGPRRRTGPSRAALQRY